jgi:hypothetical protein
MHVNSVLQVSFNLKKSKGPLHDRSYTRLSVMVHSRDKEFRLRDQETILTTCHMIYYSQSSRSLSSDRHITTDNILLTLLSQPKVGSVGTHHHHPLPLALLQVWGRLLLLLSAPPGTHQLGLGGPEIATV